jgi:hypothetical protein
MNAIAEVTAPTLEHVAAEDHLLDTIISALRTLETNGDVRQVVASPAHGVIVVIDGPPNYSHVALRVVS